MFAADIVPVGFGDRAQRDLAHLRAATHDDDALAVDFLHGLDLRDLLHDGQARAGRRPVSAGSPGTRSRNRSVARAFLHDFDAQDIALVRGDDAGELVQHAGARIAAVTSIPILLRHYYSTSYFFRISAQRPWA